MSSRQIDRRRVLVGAGALGAAAMLPSPASAKGSVTAAIYPGTWDEAYRSIVAPALKKAKDIDLALEPLFAVDQIAKAQAARGAPPFDAFVLDPGPRASAIDRGLFEKFDASKLANASKVPAGFADAHGIAVNTQIVGIAYNPKKLPKPKSWKDLFAEPYVSRLGLTGFQTTFGTVSLIEIAKAYGGSDTNVEPAFVEVKKALPKAAAVMTPASLPGLFQQGQIDICTPTPTTWPRSRPAASTSTSPSRRKERSPSSPRCTSPRGPRTSRTPMPTSIRPCRPRCRPS